MTGCGYYIKVPHSMIFDQRLTNAAYRVLHVYMSYANGEGWCYPKQETVASLLHMDRSTLAGHVKQLRELGYLETDRRGKLNYSHVMAPSLEVERVGSPNTSDPNMLGEPTHNDERVGSPNMNVLGEPTPEQEPIELEGTSPEQTFTPVVDLPGSGGALAPPAPLAASPPTREPRKAQGSGKRPKAEPPPEVLVDEPFIERMVAKWGDQLGGDEAIRETIAYALGYHTTQQYPNKQLVVQRWLRRDVEDRQARRERRHAPNPQTRQTDREESYGEWPTSDVDEGYFDEYLELAVNGPALLEQHRQSTAGRVGTRAG